MSVIVGLRSYAAKANILPEQFGLIIAYTDTMGNMRHYEPDFVAVDTDGVHYLLETKGLEDINVANKDRSAKLLAENATALTGTAWRYLKVLETKFKSLQPDTLADLIATDGTGSPSDSVSYRFSSQPMSWWPGSKCRGPVAAVGSS